MGLSARHVGELTAELEPLLGGYRVQAVQPHPPRDLLLICIPGDALHDAEGPIRRLRLSAEPGLSRFHLQLSRLQRHKGSVSPFYQQVQKSFEGARALAFEHLGGDRLLAVRARPKEGAPGTELALVLELTGRHPNLLLLRDGEIVARLIEPRSKSGSSERLAVGARYAPPTGGTPPASPPLLEALVVEGAAGGEHYGELAERAPLSRRVEETLGIQAVALYENSERADLVRRFERRVKGTADLIRGLEERARQADRAERVRQDGELLNAHLGEIERGMKEITLPDAFQPDAPPRTLALDPGLNARRNVEKFFARYKKLKRSAERVPEEIELARVQLQRAEDFLERIESGDEELATLEEQAIAEGVLLPKQDPKKKRQAPRKPYLSFRSGRGAEIRVGRTAADNDTLTFKESRGNDLWLHTADSPGSHVILRLEKGAQPDPEDTLDAALLAAHFSPLRGAAKVDVHVARRKEVKKPRKAKAGLVVLSGGKTLHVRLDPPRLERLLKTRRGPA